ncbi:MAG: hypothetical protein GX434_16120 [Peptococcaceae bacterium]|nr:hypothetical protein [Peptococcaceae bacterium]
MIKEDLILLESFERIFQVIQNEVVNLRDTKSIHAERVRQWEKEIRAYARILEDISLPARMILEHILELKYKSGQMAVEAENINQGFSQINDVQVEEFGIIKISTGNIQLSWRDEFYNYLLYPDKVELRTLDEKSLIKLFFSHNFGRQDVHKFSEIAESPKLLYLHPTLQKFIEKNSE